MNAQPFASSSDPQHPEAMGGTVRRIWTLFAPGDRRKAMLMLALIVLMALTETAGVLSIMPFLSVLSRPGIIEENEWLRAAFDASGLDDPRSFTIALGLASILVVVCSSAFKVVTQHILNRFVHFLRHSISTRLLGKYLHQPYSFFLSRNSADLSKNLLSETDLLLNNLIQPLSQLLAQGTVVLAMVILVVVYDPWMAACVVVVIGGLYALIYSLVRSRLSRTGAERVNANRERYQASNEALAGIKDVKVANSAPAYSERFNRASREFSRHLATSETLSQTPLYLVEAVGYSGLILIALVLLVRNDDIAQVLPALGLYGFAAYRMLPAVQVMYRGFARLRFSSPALGAISSDLGLPDPEPQPAGRILAPEHEVKLEGVRFSYPSSSGKPLFDHLDIAIPANSTVGIVGRSGSGKSTAMDLLLGLLEPQSGVLRVDDVVIDGGNVRDWHRSIGYVPQHIFLSDASVAENIAFGVAGTQIDMFSVERAARLAQIHDFISTELPEGYATRVGERGIRLSGGQRQRIGIARALYRDPPVLFMDEATSALDSVTESQITEGLHSLAGKKTIVIIAHRETTLGCCHSVIDLEDRQ